MSSRFHVPLLALLTFALAACGGATDEAEGVTPTTPSTEAAAEPAPPATPRIEAGVQVVEIEAGPMGYTPRAVTLEAGVPARLVFTRTVESECSAQVQVPAFDVAAIDLPMHEPVAVEFTPSEAGDFTFVCGMDMQRGTVVVKS